MTRSLKYVLLFIILWLQYQVFEIFEIFISRILQKSYLVLSTIWFEIAKILQNMVALIFHAFETSFPGWHLIMDKISEHYTRRDLSSAPLLLLTTGIFTSKPLHAYILYLISEPIHAWWIGSEILHNPSLSVLLMNGTPTLGRPSLCAAEV